MEIDKENVPGPLDEETVAEALSDAYARRILTVCADDPRSVKDISDAAGIPLASTYRHVRSLVSDGVLVRARSAISPEGKRYDLFRSRIQRANLELTPKGVDVTWEVDPEIEDRLDRIRKELR